MPLHQAVILAIVQGVTEFLPISSSAHLALAPWLFGWQDQGLAFDIALHFGTLLAVLLYFGRDLIQVIGAGFGLRTGTDPDLRDNPKLLWMLIAATIPVGIAGLQLEKYAETTLRGPWTIGFMLIAVGFLMGYPEEVDICRKTICHVTWMDALHIDVSQALCVVARP